VVTRECVSVSEDFDLVVYNAQILYYCTSVYPLVIKLTDFVSYQRF